MKRHIMLLLCLKDCQSHSLHDWVMMRMKCDYWWELSGSSWAEYAVLDLFMATGQGKMISWNMVCFWLREVISGTYKFAADTDWMFVILKGNKVRTTISSLLFKNSFAVRQVLWTVVVTVHCCCFYLRDIIHNSMDMFPIGLAVSSQWVV